MPPPSRAEVGAILAAHLENLYAFYGEHQGVRIARKHIGWYCKDAEGAAVFRALVNPCEHAAHQLALTREFFGSQPGREQLAA